MKLKDVVASVDISLVSDRPVLVKDVLSHLSFLIDGAESGKRGIQWRINDIYRDVALDLLKLSGESDTGITDVQKRSKNIVK